MNSMLRWALFLPATITINFLVRIPIIWLFTNIIPILTRPTADFEFSWWSIVLVGVRENLATMATLYVGIKLVDSHKKIAFFLAIGISAVIPLLGLVNYPISFNEIGFWKLLNEVTLLAAQFVGIYAAVVYFKREFQFGSLKKIKSAHIDEYQKHPIKLFETNSGPIYSETKVIAECRVPLGCFNDPANRFDALKKRLNDSVFPTLKQVEQVVKEKFMIKAGDIIYDACISKQWRKNIHLNKVKELTEQYLSQNGDDDFELRIIVNCKRQITPNDVQIWGTIINIEYLRDDWYDKVDDEEYQVWSISIEGIMTTIDDPLTTEEIERIKISILDHMKRDFDEYYGGLQKGQ